MKIQVRKCRFTGKLFEEKNLNKYKKHLEQLRNKMAYERHLARTKREFKAWLEKEKEQIIHVSEIAPWFLKNQRYIMDAFNSGCRSVNSYYDKDKIFMEGDKFTELDIEVRYIDKVSNTHVCPDTGVTNWQWTLDLPRGYAGFSGRVTGSIVCDKRQRHYLSTTDLLKLVGIKTGSGGGGDSSWGYNVSIFLDDWAGLKHQAIVNKLKGE
jgi:hypothetical protein